MKKIIKSNDRGKTNIDWLNSHHSFSFGHYYDPEMMGFGALRVVNDDIIAPKKGFGMHPHDNMEIITIVTKGSLSHGDSLGSSSTLVPGMVQVMSAGTGIVHKEINQGDIPVELFQIWIEPSIRNIKPRYEEREFSKEGLVTVAGRDEGILIQQNAYIKIGNFKEATTLEFIPKEGRGLFLLVIEGKVNELETRDTLMTDEETQLNIEAETSVLWIEVAL